MLDNEDLQILSSLKETCSKNGIFSIDLLTQETLKKLFDVFENMVSKKAEDINYPNELPDGLDIELFYEKATTRVKTETVRDKIQKSAYFFLSQVDKNKDYLDVINFLMSKSIGELTNYFEEKSLETFAIFYGYLGYIIDVQNGKITKSTLIRLKRTFPWIEDIKEYKGFSTINDKVRKVMSSIFDMLYDIGLDDKAIFYSLDDYFANPRPDYFLSRYAPEYAKDYFTVISFKKYIIRIMLSDVYLNLKAHEDEDDEYRSDEKLLDYIERAIEQNDYRLPHDDEIRKELYLEAASCLRTDYDRHFLTSILVYNDEIKKLELANPLYFLD